MPLPALLAVTALAGAASLSGRTQAGSRARMTAAQAEAHRARLVELLRAGRWRDALELNKVEGKSRLDLGRADLSSTNLTNANLSDANLGLASLSSADLSGANLSDADLTNANLANANLKGSVLTGADLSSADLSGADLSGADLTNANPTITNLAHANLAGARLPEGFLAPNTHLDAVPWKGTPYGWRVIASLRGARFHPAAQA